MDKDGEEALWKPDQSLPYLLARLNERPPKSLRLIPTGWREWRSGFRFAPLLAPKTSCWSSRFGLHWRISSLLSTARTRSTA